MEWSDYQKEIFYQVAETNKSLIIEAVAGSGKTTTIVEAIKHVPATQTICFLAFNKSIADVLKQKVTSPNARCMTLHSAGFSAWRKYLGGSSWSCKVDSGKTRGIFQQFDIEDRVRYGAEIVKLVSIAKGQGIVPRERAEEFKGLVEDDEQVWEDMIDFYDLDRDGCSMEVAREVLSLSIDAAPGLIDFDDQLYCPIITGAPFDKYDVIFLDEAQDVSAIQAEMVSRMRKESSRVIAVGDPHQCQPSGTLVSVIGRSPVPIEMIKKGDHVVSYVKNESRFTGGMTGGKLVKSVARRPYSGELMRISAGGRTSVCTPEHKWLVRFNSKVVGKFCVYLMRRGPWWRIGSCRLRYGKRGFGPSTRAWREKADDLWILSVHDNYTSAFSTECILSATFGLSLVPFEQGKSPRCVENYSQEVIEKVFDAIPDQSEKAARVLKTHGLSGSYPHISRSTTENIRFRLSGKNSFVCPAVNILPEVMSVAVYPSKKWEPISVFRQKYEGDVWSLEVDGGLYVADGLLTHNSIYGFRGCLSNSMNLLKERFGCHSLPLSVSYRCPKSIVKKAQEYVSHIQSHESAVEGLVKEDVGSWPLKQFLPTDAILCRNTRPLIEVAFLLIRNKVSCRVLGRDIGQGLVKLVKKMKAFNVLDLTKKLANYRSKEAQKLIAQGKEDKLASLDDKLDTLSVFMEEVGIDAPVSELISAIEALFSDDSMGRLTLSTIHKFKGLEADRVFILDKFLMPSPYARQQWQKEQESNLAYVAITRSKGELYYVTSETLRSAECLESLDSGGSSQSQPTPA